MTTVWRNPRFVKKCFNCGIGLEFDCYHEMGLISNFPELYDKPFCSRECVKLKYNKIIADKRSNLNDFYAAIIIVGASLLIWYLCS